MIDFFKSLEHRADNLLTRIGQIFLITGVLFATYMFYAKHRAAWERENFKEKEEIEVIVYLDHKSNKIAYRGYKTFVANRKDQIHKFCFPMKKYLNNICNMYERNRIRVRHLVRSDSDLDHQYCIEVNMRERSCSIIIDSNKK